MPAAGSAGVGDSLALDAKHLSKPSKFKDKDSEYTEWRSQLTNYLMTVDLGYANLMDQIEKATVPFATFSTDQAELKAHTLLL